MMGIPKRHLIYGAMTFFSLLGAIMKVTVLDGPGHGLLVLYLGILYVAFMVWAIGQLRTIEMKEQEEHAASSPVTLPPGEPLSEEMLFSAETYLSLGESLDTVCRFVEPRYVDWDLAEKQAFRHKLRAEIEERRLKESD